MLLIFLSFRFWNILLCLFHVCRFYCVHFCKSKFLIHGLWIQWLNPYNLKPKFHIIFYNDWSNVVSIHLVNVTLFNSMELLLTMATSLSFLNAILNGLKHERSKGCEIWDGRVTMSKPNWWAYSIACKVPRNPWPSKISRWQLVKRSHQELTFWKKIETFWTNKLSSKPSFALPYMRLVCNF